jgi:hypothetical protein
MPKKKGGAIASPFFQVQFEISHLRFEIYFPSAILFMNLKPSV